MDDQKQSLPGFYSVIPSYVRYHQGLSPMDKLIYAEISALCDKYGYCWCTNHYLSKQFRLSERWVRKTISRLCLLKFITIQHNEGKSRFLRLTAPQAFQDPGSTVPPYPGTVLPPEQNFHPLIYEQDSEAPLCSRSSPASQAQNTQKATPLVRHKKLPDPEAPILYLNEKTKKSFDPKNRANRDLVQARYNEGRTLEQFKLVIDRKCADWETDEKMIKYLRPSTLFSRTNFENYLNEGGDIGHTDKPWIRKN